MTVVSEEKAVNGVLFVVLPFAFCLPFVGWLISMIFGGMSFFAALTKTKSISNALHVVAGFALYWLIVYLFVSREDGKIDLFMLSVVLYFYSFAWMIWMQKKTRVLS